jgi:hypothetical protein
MIGIKGIHHPTILTGHGRQQKSITAVPKPEERAEKKECDDPIRVKGRGSPARG